MILNQPQIISIIKDRNTYLSTSSSSRLLSY